MVGRKSTLCILLILFTVVTTVLPAVTPVRIGLLGVDLTGTSSSHLQQIFSFVSSQDSGQFTYASYEALVENRLAKTRALDELVRNHRLIEESDGDSLVVAERDDSNEEELLSQQESNNLVEWIIIDESDPLRTALARKDGIVADYMMKAYKIDLLLVCVVEHFEPLLRLRIEEFRSDGITRLVYEDLVISSELATLKEPAMLAIMSAYRGSPIGMVHLNSTPPGLSVSVDGGEKQRVRDSLMVLSEGEHVLVFSAPGYEEKTQSVSVESGSVEKLKVELEKVEGPPVLITSDSGYTDITIPHVIDKQVPFIWESQHNPFVLYAIEDGKRLATYQFTEPIDEVNISLQPQWLDPVYGTARAQEDLYASLGRTLILGGLTIILDSVSRSVASYTNDLRMWQPAILGAAGAMAVSLFDTGAGLFAYYQKTKYSSRY